MGILSKLFSKKDISSKKIASNPEKLFDENDPNEVFSLIRNLSWLVANVGSFSCVYIAYQDADKNNNGIPILSISANLDDWKSNGYHPNYESFVKLGLSKKSAKYLESIPFSESGDLLMFTFKNPPSHPSGFRTNMINEIHKGLSLSRFVQVGVRDIKIEDNTGVIICRVD